MKFAMKGQLYAIRHIPSHSYMPRLDGRGYTARVEVEDLVKARKIRFFDSRAGASRALKCWLRGPYSKQVTHQDFFTGEWDVYGGEPPSGPPPVNRKAEEFEIVLFCFEEERSQ